MPRTLRWRRRIGMGDSLRPERLYAELPLLIPQEPPALFARRTLERQLPLRCERKAGAHNPTVYFSHREMDIAMTKMFGGFEPAFYSAYNAERPMQQGWEERVDLYNLYPLLVHVNLFGGGYAAQLQQALKHFTHGPISA